MNFFAMNKSSALFLTALLQNVLSAALACCFVMFFALAVGVFSGFRKVSSELVNYLNRVSSHEKR